MLREVPQNPAQVATKHHHMIKDTASSKQLAILHSVMERILGVARQSFAAILILMGMLTTPQNAPTSDVDSDISIRTLICVPLHRLRSERFFWLEFEQLR